MSGSRGSSRSGSCCPPAERVWRLLIRICLIGVTSFQVAQRPSAGCSFCVPGAGAATVVKTLLGCGGTGLGGIGQLADMQSVRTVAVGRVDSRGPGQIGGAEAWSA